MKTLTLFRAFLKAKEKEEHAYWEFERGRLTPGAQKMLRQIATFYKALTKRLQEQEEELKKLRGIEIAQLQENYDIAVTAFAMSNNAYAMSGNNAQCKREQLDKHYRMLEARKALKEKTNE